MYLHKYEAEGDTFYRVTGKSGKPAGSVNLLSENWKGASTGAKVNEALSLIKASFQEEKKPEPESEEKKASISGMLRSLADQVEKEQEEDA